MSNNISTEKSIMSIEQIDLISSFESMSNELLMELFEYYDLYSLFYSYGSLNSRISNIIYHCDVSVDFDKVNSTDTVDFFGGILSKFNANKIRSLNSSISCMTGVIARDKCLIYFKNIRSLSLNNIESKIIEYMLSRIHFSSLERVSFGECEDVSFDSWRIFKHFIDSNRYKYLRIYKDCHGGIEDLTSVLLFEYVTFSYPSGPYHFLNFLNQCPYLKFIKCVLSFSDRYPKPVFLLPNPCYNTVTHLNLALYHKFCTKTIGYIFQCVPRVHDLKLIIDTPYFPELADPKYWEILLSKYLLELKQLYLMIIVFHGNNSSTPVWDYLMNNKNEIIEQIKKSNYWSSHHWKVTFDSYLRTPHPYDYVAKFQVV